MHTQYILFNLSKYSVRAGMCAFNTFANVNAIESDYLLVFLYTKCTSD